MSLAETLVTVAIFSIVLVAVTTGSTAAYHVYKKVSEKADAETLLSTSILAVSEDLYNASDVVLQGDTDESSFGTVLYFYNKALNYNENFSNESDSSDSSKTIINRKLWKIDEEVTPDTDAKNPVIADKTQTLGLYAKLDSTIGLQYCAAKNCFKFKVIVYDKNEKQIAEQIAYAHGLE